MRVYRPMTSSVSVQRGRRTSRAAEHRLDEPARLSLGMVASLQSPPPFRPASSSVTTCRFSTSLARDSARTQTCQTRIVSVIAYVTPICSRAAALRRHPLGKIVKRTREEMVIRAECGGLRSFTQLLARLPLVLLAGALTGRLRSHGIRSHQ